MYRGTWQAVVHGVTESQTQLRLTTTTTFSKLSPLSTLCCIHVHALPVLENVNNQNIKII